MVSAGTPSNIACGLPAGNRARAVAGLNPPMPVREMNHAHQGFEKLAEQAVTGGREGVYAGSEA